LLVCFGNTMPRTENRDSHRNITSLKYPNVSV
jgi:hypothetical protein